MSLSIETVLTLLEAHPYLLLFPLILVEGPITTIAAGLLVTMGLIQWPVAYAVAVTADLTGDTFYYLLGCSARHPRAGRWIARLGLTQERLAALEASFRRNDARALVGAKIADAAAIPMFVAAGLMNLSYRRFLMWTAAATLPKAGLLMVIGYVAGGQALALAGRLEPRWAVSLALLALVTVTYLLVAKKVLFRGAHNPSHTLTQGGKR